MTRNEQDPAEFESLNLADLWRRIALGMNQIIGLGLIGMVAAAAFFWIFSPALVVSTTIRVVFSFKGLEKGEYPDGTRFQADDLRSPNIIAEALKRQGLETSPDYQGRIRGALSVEGLVSQEIIKERDRQRAANQTPAIYIPDEYMITLTLPGHFPLGSRQRELLLNEIVNVFHENFTQTFGTVPTGFGDVFDTLKTSDYPDYELIFREELIRINDYLTTRAKESPGFRSQRTNFTFQDLSEQVRLFEQLNLNNVMGYIYENKLSKDPKAALARISFQLQSLEANEVRGSEEEKFIQGLLANDVEKQQAYVLGTKSNIQTSKAESPVLDQGLIDSLLKNDSYNFLIRKALDSGLKLYELEGRKHQLLAQQKRIQDSVAEKIDPSTQQGAMQQVQMMLAETAKRYDSIIIAIRTTNEDFVTQEFGDAVRVSSQAKTGNIIKTWSLVGCTGLFLGLFAGIGFSLIGVHFGKKVTEAA